MEGWKIRLVRVKLPKVTLGLGVPDRDLKQIPVAEYVATENETNVATEVARAADAAQGEWRIWVSYDNTQTVIQVGTYIELKGDGSAWRITVDKTGEIVREIKLV